MLKARFRKDLEFAHIATGMFFSRFGISPNVWTAMSILPAVAGLLLLLGGHLAYGALGFFISAFMDIIDGNVARVTKSVSSFGAFMDGVVDRYVEILLYLGILVYAGAGTFLMVPNAVWILLLSFSAMMPSFITAYADHRKVVCDQKALNDMGGILERFERLGIIYAGMLAQIWWDGALMIAVVSVVFLSNITALQRLSKVVANT